MTIEISPESSKAAIASIQRYFSENLAEEIGNLDAGALLGFFLKEIAPVVTTRPWPTHKRVCKLGSWSWMLRFTRTNFSIG